MSPTVVRTLRIDMNQWGAMQFVEDRDGVPVVEQVRRGVRMWLESKGVHPVDFDTPAYDSKRKRKPFRKPKSS